MVCNGKLWYFMKNLWRILYIVRVLDKMAIYRKEVKIFKFLCAKKWG